MHRSVWFYDCFAAERGLRPLLQGCVCNVAFVAVGEAGVRVGPRSGEALANAGGLVSLMHRSVRFYDCCAAERGLRPLLQGYVRTAAFVAAGVAGVRVGPRSGEALANTATR
ncbi:hypothetical protein [Pseudomonas sp. PAB10]|uniref:hypothetical protein n=1 Tax=Pseudomonas sp. PAB10 TaxID=3233047 RepID=UPI003F985115